MAVEQSAAGPGESYAADDPHVDDSDERHAGAERGGSADQEPESAGGCKKINLKRAPFVLRPVRAVEGLHTVYLPQLREPHEHATDDEAPSSEVRCVEGGNDEDTAKQVQQAANGAEEKVQPQKVTGFAVTGIAGSLHEGRVLGTVIDELVALETGWGVQQPFLNVGYQESQTAKGEEQAALKVAVLVGQGRVVLGVIQDAADEEGQASVYVTGAVNKEPKERKFGLVSFARHSQAER